MLTEQIHCGFNERRHYRRHPIRKFYLIMLDFILAWWKQLDPKEHDRRTNERWRKQGI